MTTEHHKIELDAVAGARPEFWSQEVVGQANANLFKVAKGLGSTEWHCHEDQDEVFVVISGELVVQFRSGDVSVGAGELLVVPRGVEHCPKAEDEVHFLLVGPEVTSNDAGGKPAWSYGAGTPPSATS